MKRRLFSPIMLAAVLSGCSQFPSGGPGDSTLVQKPVTGELIHVITPEMAVSESEKLEQQQKKKTIAAIIALRDYASAHPYQSILRVGDTLRVHLWSYTGLTTDNGPRLVQTNLSKITINRQGWISLPYIKPLHIAGKTVEMADNLIANAYAKKEILESPQVQVQIIRNTSGIWVYGSVTRHFLAWTTKGWTLAQALSYVGGENVTARGSSSTGTILHETSISVLYHDRLIAKLPIDKALLYHVPLVPGERLVENTSAPVQVTVLGSGITNPGSYSFSGNVTVSQVLAMARGLNGSTANYREVLLYHPKSDGQVELSVFRWGKNSGFLAAQRYLVKNNSVLYISSQQIVKLSRALGMVLDAALPVQAFK